MTEPTITQSGALYLAHHKPKHFRAGRRRLLTGRINKLRDRARTAFGDAIDVRRLHLER